VIVYFVDRSIVESEKQLFTRLVTEAELRIKQKMASLEDALRGATSYVAASQRIHRDEWRAYVETFKFKERYPSTLALGLVFPFDSEKDPRISEIRKDYSEPFLIKTVSGGARVA
ncbi:MAG: hypothetical protein V4692_08940, partial [Bdellovibrionota bacterium]